MGELGLTWVAAVAVALVAVVVGVAVYWIGYRAGSGRASAKMEAGFRDRQRRSRLTLGGRFAEQLSPFFEEFRYDPTEARFLGSPIDFVVFPGLATGEPREIVFVEVKRGRARLDRGQRRLRDLVNAAGVEGIRFETLRVMEPDRGDDEDDGQ
jgi:predicted Holliday junction resolvase-like endonuclease